MTIIAGIYFIVGLIVYFVTDTTKFASKLERKLVLPSRGDINKQLFIFVVVLWPVWLVINATSNE